MYHDQTRGRASPSQTVPVGLMTTARRRRCASPAFRDTGTHRPL
ncbi:hypothetical protein NY78_1458 [Desulfovibrio sp. TomC]|nr:hypothetical protein NY78_1458 [Desulfovibrio sp. TomC]